MRQPDQPRPLTVATMSQHVERCILKTTTDTESVASTVKSHQGYEYPV